MKTRIESTAKVLLVNEKSEALILTISEYEGHPEKSYTPDLPGGMVDPGETAFQAVVRELEEETGIRLPVDAFQLGYVETVFYPDPDRSVTKFLFTAQIAETPEVCVSWEHASFEWVPVERLGAVSLRPFFRTAVDYCIAHGLVDGAEA